MLARILAVHFFRTCLFKSLGVRETLENPATLRENGRVITGVMGGKQFGFGDHEQSTAKKRTRRERFLAQMEAVVPWSALIDLIEPSYPRPAVREVGRPIRLRPCCGFT